MPVSGWHDLNLHTATFQLVPFLSMAKFKKSANKKSSVNLKNGEENEAVKKGTKFRQRIQKPNTVNFGRLPNIVGKRSFL